MIRLFSACGVLILAVFPRVTSAASAAPIPDADIQALRQDASAWEADAALVTMGKPCDVITALWDVKVQILEQLGRNDEAAVLRKQLKGPAVVDGPSLYKEFHERLTALRGTPCR